MFRQHDINSLWPIVTYIMSMNWCSIGLDNGLSPVRRQALTLTNTDLLSIAPTWFDEISINKQTVLAIISHKDALENNDVCKISASFFRPFRWGLKILKVNEYLCFISTRMPWLSVNLPRCPAWRALAPSHVAWCQCLRPQHKLTSSVIVGPLWRFRT